MSRPKQCRIVSTPPPADGFRPYGGPYKGPRGGRRRRRKASILQYDEYEAVRLLDYEGKQQAEAAAVMGVSRPTLPRIYDGARKVIAESLVEGRRLEISGGNVNFEGKFKNIITHNIMKQKIAIPTSEGKLSAHFGKAPEITFITIEEGKITGQEVLKAPEHEHGAMPRFMAKNGATDVLCGCLGAGAMDLVKRLGMNLHAGAPALPVDEVVKQYLEETIEYEQDSNCDHSGCGEHHRHRHGNC